VLVLASMRVAKGHSPLVTFTGSYIALQPKQRGRLQYDRTDEPPTGASVLRCLVHIVCLWLELTVRSTSYTGVYPANSNAGA
jgi:hypothetical protein